MSMFKGSWKWVVLFFVFVVVVVVLVMVFFGVFSGNEDTGVFGDAEYDVFLSMGESSLGMVDLTGGSLEVVGSRLVVGFSTREPVVGLGEGELASYDVLLILENDTSVIRSYEFLLEVNSTGRFSSLVDVDSGMEVNHKLVVDQSGVSVSVDVGGVEVPTIVEWGVSSVYERLSGEELVTYGFDFAPDEGVHTTFLDEDVEE